MKPIKLALIAFAIMATISCNEAPVQQESQYDNAAIENMMTRRSIRKYTDQAVPRELLNQIAECGINAPNGMNAQQWEVRVVMSEEWINSATLAAKEAAKGTPNEAQFNDPSFKTKVHKIFIK